MKKLPLILALSLITVLILSSASQAQDPKANLRQGPCQINFTPIAGGNPLQILVGKDNSFQVIHQNWPGNGQIFPTTSVDCPADMGVFVRIPAGSGMSGTLYAPDFGDHEQTATGGLGTYTPWTFVLLTGLTGVGTDIDPWTVTVISKAVDPGGVELLRMTMTVTYVNDEKYFRHYCMFTNISGGPICFDAYVGSDIYLANSDKGIPYYWAANGSVGGQNCPNQDYTIIHIPLSPGPADAYTARYFNTVWTEIGTGHLDNQIDPATCSPNGIDDGAALEWQNICLQLDESVTIRSVTSFGDIPAIVPDTDAWIQDYYPCDYGIEPDPCPQPGTPMWMSDDIRVRHNPVMPPTNAFLPNYPHQNPIAGQSNYVYVKLRSRGSAPVCGDIRLYWADASTGLSWDTKNTPNPDDDTWGASIVGGEITPKRRMYLGSWPDWDVAEFTWIPPSPGHICLLARFVSLSNYADPMVDEGTDIWINTAKNNNIAWKNLIVVNPWISPSPDVWYFIVRNVNPWSSNLDLEFNSAGGGDGIPFLEGGSVRVVLSPEMFSNWMGAGGIGQGISVNPSDSSISLTSTLAKIQGIPMGANETQPVKMKFSANSGNSTPAFQWFVVSQFSDGKTTPDGGITFEFRSSGGSIPTLSEWGLIIFGVVLLGFISWVFLRRRKAAVNLR